MQHLGILQIPVVHLVVTAYVAKTKTLKSIRFFTCKCFIDIEKTDLVD